jgi:predicted Zn-dependent protease
MMSDKISEKIIAAIGKANAGSGAKIADWRLVANHVARQEQYFVREKIEQTRVVDEMQYSLTVYVDAESKGEKVRGEATVTIQPSFGDAEIEQKVRQAAFAASKSRNPWFALPGPAEAKVELPRSGFDSLKETSRMSHVRDALYMPETEFASAGRQGAPTESPDKAPPTHPRINALELFISRETKDFQNSKGQRFSSTAWRGYSEFVVEAGSDKGPVELFDDIEFSDPELARLSAATRARLIQVRDRAVAIPLPAMKEIPVILSGKEAEEVFSWFFGNSTTSMVFAKASAFELGMNVQKAEDGANVEDPFDMWAEPFLQGLPASSAFDPDGFPLERTQIIEAGILKNLIGPVRHADWLKVPRKGNFAQFSVSPGTMSAAEMKAEPYLAPVMFSDFRLDGVTGDFGAEMRLAYYFDGKKRIPVTGGSISGSLSQLRSTMRRSAERTTGTRSLCPQALLLRGVSVTSME